MKKKLFLVGIIIVNMIFLVSCENIEKSEEINLSLASSLYKPFSEIEDIYEKDNIETRLQINYGSSSSIEKQIENGANVDIFISASTEYSDKLLEKNIVNGNQIKNFLKNELILVRNKSAKEIKSIEELKNIKGVIGLVQEGVPLGNYSIDVLNSINLINDANEDIIYAKDANSLLTYLECGEVDYGLIYKNQLFESKNIVQVEKINQNLYQEVIYTLVILNENDKTKKLKDFLEGEESKNILKKYGFEVIQ
ncbi:MAG: molybdate ABC transporter substrate-binding protein [Sarcina sp.]